MIYQSPGVILILLIIFCKVPCWVPTIEYEFDRTKWKRKKPVGGLCQRCFIEQKRIKFIECENKSKISQNSSEKDEKVQVMRKAKSKTLISSRRVCSSLDLPFGRSCPPFID